MAQQIQIANLAQFLASVQAARKQVSDLTVPMTAIARDWMRTNETFFSLGGPGPWADLSAAGPRSKVRGFGPKKTGEADGQVAGYKREKLKRWGFIYPILEASGALKRSLTVPGDPGSLFELLNGTMLNLGTKVVSKGGASYPFFLNDGTHKMVARPFMAVSQLSVARWVKILSDYVQQAVQNPGSTATSGE